MKITDSNSVTIQGRRDLLDAFRRLPEGTRITARIAERIGPHRAVIEMKGARLQAEFVKGLPAGSSLSLVLKSKTATTLVFGLADEARDGNLQRLGEYLVFRVKDIPTSIFHNLAGSLKGSIQGIFALNLMAMGIKNPEREGKSRIVGLLNRLLAMGIKNDHLVFISYLFSAGRGINFNYLMPFLALLEGGKYSNPYIEHEKTGDRGGIPAQMDSLFSELDSLVRKSGDDGKILVQEFLEELISGTARNGLNAYSGIIPYFENEFRELRYIAAGNAFAVSLKFSRLGRVDILARDAGGSILISLFCEGEAEKSDIQDKIDKVGREISRVTGKKTVLTVLVNRQAIENVIEINSLLMLDGVFSIKA